MATTVSDTQRPQRKGGGNGLLETGFEPGDDVDQVLVGIDAEDEAVVDEVVSDSQPLATTHGAREEKTAASNGVGSDSAFA